MWLGPQYLSPSEGQLIAAAATAAVAIRNLRHAIKTHRIRTRVMAATWLAATDDDDDDGAAITHKYHMYTHR